MKQAPSGLDVGDPNTQTFSEVVLKDGILNAKELGQYEASRLREFRKELYELAKADDTWAPKYYTTIITMINSELETREPKSNR